MIKHSSQHGIALVYVLLIVFLITAIALTISIVIINELRLTRTAADATLAYYAAESGIERGLFTVKQMRTDTANTLNDAIDAVRGLNASLTNGTSYDDNETSDQSALIENQFIAEDRFVQADYYDFENPLNPDTKDIAVSLEISNNGNDPFTWAEVSWIAWGSDGTLGESSSARKLIGPTDLVRGWTIPTLDTFTNIDPRGYRIRIKSLFGDLSSVTAKAYNEDGDPVDLPSLIQIKSIGERTSYKQALTATVPWKIPLYGLYDYVLFSESELMKTIILSDPTYTSGPINVEEDMGEPVACNSCGECQGDNWQVITCYPATAASCGTISDDAGCYINPGALIYGFALPIPPGVVAGDSYYVSARMYYQCSGGCSGRDVAVEINGQSSVIRDQAEGSSDAVWRTCTLPETFTVGDVNLPEGNIARTVKFTDHPYGAGSWSSNDSVFIDWYQLSTYKLFQDCE